MFTARYDIYSMARFATVDSYLKQLNIKANQISESPMMLSEIMGFHPKLQ
jgi:hypothetical protein